MDKQTIPKIHVSGKLPNSDSGTVPSSENEAEVLGNLQWSHAIDLLVAADNFVTLPGVADVKVHVQQIAMVTHVTISPITKADVSAKEIRSRLKGKDRTITVSSQSEVKEHNLNISADGKEKLDTRTIESEKLKDSLVISKKQEEELKQKQSTKISFGVLMNKVTLIVLDEVSSVTSKNEIIQLTMEELFFATYPVSELVERPGYQRNCVVLSIGDIQLDNQVQSTGNFDFPVVLVRQNFEKVITGKDLGLLYQMSVIEKHAVLKSTSLVHVQVVYGVLDGRAAVIETVDCAMKPVNFYIDDTFIFHCLKEVGNFLPLPLSKPEPLRVLVLKLPSKVKSISKTLSCPFVIGHLSIQPVSMLFSIHASMKVFIASDHTPLSFGKFEKVHLSTTSYQLIRSLAMHYAFGALFKAGKLNFSMRSSLIIDILKTTSYQNLKFSYLSGFKNLFIKLVQFYFYKFHITFWLF